MSKLFDDLSMEQNYKLTGNPPRKYKIIRQGKVGCPHNEPIVKVGFNLERGECKYCHQIKEYWEEIPDKLLRSQNPGWLSVVLKGG